MKIKRMTATFGKLEGATLELKEGLNVIQAPNEGGKSTWCAFLRAMFYGVPTRERDTKTTLAEKNRYAPWSGSPMAGEILLTWGGRDVILRRFAKGTSPFGGFEAVEADTGEQVPGLTGENCGEMLLGVGREVYQRSAFVGQSQVSIDADPELERRIAALVSSGEEDVSFSETEKTLKSWLNRRKHNKTGLIPRLEEETAALDERLTQVRQNTRRLQEAQAQAGALVEQQTALETEQAAWRARQEWARWEQYSTAVKELDAAQQDLIMLEGESGPLPSKETLRQAQGDLVYYNTMGTGVKEGKNRLEPARAAVDAAERAAEDPLFPGMDPEEAWKKATGDAERVRELEKKKSKGQTVVGTLFLLAAAATAVGGLTTGNPLFFAGAGLGALAGIGLLLSGHKAGRNRERQRSELLAHYGAGYPDDILSRATAYREKWVAVEEARRNAETVENSIRDLSARRDDLWERLLGFVHGFAPTVTAPFGVSAALSRALSLDERIATARVKAQGAQRLVDSLPAPEGEKPGTPPPAPLGRTLQQATAALTAVNGELGRVRGELARAQGQRTALGDQEELESRLEEAGEDLAGRQEEHRALGTALEALAEANGELQARFSPELNRRAGELFAALTGGRYEGVTLTREFEAAARETGGVLPRRALSLSQGTVEQLYLAVRLAVCEMALPGADPAPLVLDDALSNFDDGRMALALECLKQWAEKRQILLFTCHARERAYLES